jgi:hypothetical protein
MRRIFACLVFALALVAIAHQPTAASAQTTNPCPAKTHLLVCNPPAHSFCCPDNALCVCGPIL